MDDRLYDLSRTADPDNPSRVFRWRLSRISDPSRNSVIFQYLEDSIEISYSEKAEGLQTSFRPGDYYYHVSIRFTPRADALTDVRPGFPDDYPLKGVGRINEVRVLYEDRLVRRYQMSYAQSLATSRSILTRLMEYGSDDRTAHPPLTFKYQSL